MITPRALFLDLSGVLYEGDTPIAGAPEAIRTARSRGLILRFLTNTASENSRSLLARLHKLHMDVRPEELYTAPIAAREYIRKQGLRPYCLIHPALQADFAGIDQTNPDCVLLGDAREDLNYSHLNRAFQLCMQGAPLIGIGLNKYFKTEQGLQLDAGAFIRALEWAADTRALILGKPDPAFFREVVASTGLPAEACLMVGDDVISDVQAASHAGLQSCLVRTGKYRSGDENRLPPGDQVVDSIASLFAR